MATERAPHERDHRSPRRPVLPPSPRSVHGCAEQRRRRTRPHFGHDGAWDARSHLKRRAQTTLPITLCGTLAKHRSGAGLATEGCLQQPPVAARPLVGKHCGSSALRTASSRPSSSKGLPIHRVTPTSPARSLLSRRSMCADTMTTGTSPMESLALRRRVASIPSITGTSSSLNMMSGYSLSANCTPSCPSDAKSTTVSRPTVSLISSEKTPPMSSLSSTCSTFAARAANVTLRPSPRRPTLRRRSELAAHYRIPDRQCQLAMLSPKPSCDIIAQGSLAHGGPPWYRKHRRLTSARR